MIHRHARRSTAARADARTASRRGCIPIPTARARRRHCALLALLALVAAPASVASAPAGPGGYDAKATFLLNFARLVEWPSAAAPHASEPLVVSVLGDETVERAIAQGVADQRVGDHRIAVRRIESADQVAGSHLLFVSGEVHANEQEVLDAASAHATLAIGEAEGFAQRGGMINFFTESGRLRFEINLAAAHRAGLAVSSRLLRLAVLVEDD